REVLELDTMGLLRRPQRRLARLLGGAELVLVLAPQLAQPGEVRLLGEARPRVGGAEGLGALLGGGAQAPGVVLGGGAKRLLTGGVGAGQILLVGLGGGRELALVLSVDLLEALAVLGGEIAERGPLGLVGRPQLLPEGLLVGEGLLAHGRDLLGV